MVEVNNHTCQWIESDVPGWLECAGCKAVKANLMVRGIKDSGERQTFPSGMVRDTSDGKVNYLLIRSGPMYERWAQHLTLGAQKYDADNWLKASGPEELRRFRESACRHFEQWLRGDTDEDHASGIFYNVNGAEYVLERRRREVPI